MKLLYVEDEEVLRELYIMKIEVAVDCEIIIAESVKEAIEILTKDHNYDAILADYKLPFENANILYQYVKDENLNIPFLINSASISFLDEYQIFSRFYQDNPYNKYFEKPCDFKHITSHLNKIFHKEKARTKKVFLPFPVNWLLHFDKLKHNAYLKLETHKYSKIIKKDETYHQEKIQEYQNKNIIQFFMKEQDFEEFLQEYLEVVNRKLENKDLELHEAIGIQNEVLNFIWERILDHEIDKPVVDNLVTLTQSIIYQVSKITKVCEVLNYILEKKEELSSHSLMIAYISACIAKDMECDDEVPQKQLIQASILHDVSFVEHDLALINNLQERKAQNLNEQMSRKIKSHPIKTAEKIRQRNDIFPEVDTIVLAHHERPDGSGFPFGLTAKRINKTSAIFIVTEHFVLQLMEKGPSKETIQELVENFQEIYDYPNFTEIVKSLSNIFKCELKT